SGGKISLENPGEQRAEVARVVAKFSADPSYQLPPANPQRVEFENELMRMRHIGPRGPGPAPGRMEHPAPSVLIEIASEIHATPRHASGIVEEIHRKAGDIWYQPEDPFYPEGIEKHPEHEALRIELKAKEAKP